MRTEDKTHDEMKEIYLESSLTTRDRTKLAALMRDGLDLHYPLEVDWKIY